MWEMTEAMRRTEDGISYIGYGISNGECTIHDICVDKEEMQEFIDRLNEFGASPINAADIVEDFLAER